MRRLGAAAFCALLCGRVLAQTFDYGPPPPPPLPDAYVRALAGEGALRLVLWRPAQPSGTLLAIAEEEPSLLKLARPDLLEFARSRRMTVLFLGEARAAQEEARILAQLRRDSKIRRVIGTGLGPGAGFLQELAFEKRGPLFDALLLLDPISPTPPGKTAPFVIDVLGSDAYWRRGAPALNAPAAAPNRRSFFLAGAVLSPGPGENCAAPINDRSVEPAKRALLAALDDFLKGGSAPPPSRAADLAPAKDIAWPQIPGLSAPPQGAGLVPKIDKDGNETSGLRLPDQALPLATFTGWNGKREETKGACDQGAALSFPPSPAARAEKGDPRQSLPERYGSRAYYVATLRSVADKLVKERLLLPQDADSYVAAGKRAPF